MVTLYKVLVNGRSMHGGNFKYSLPKRVEGKWVAGNWHRIPKRENLIVCTRGFHATAKPSTWWVSGARVFVAKVSAEQLVESNKVCARGIRLIRPVTDAELLDMGILTKGKHTLDAGRSYIVDGKADVQVPPDTWRVDVYGGTVRVHESLDCVTIRGGPSYTILSGASATIDIPSRRILQRGTAVIRLENSALLDASDPIPKPYKRINRNTWQSRDGLVRIIDNGGTIRW